MQIRRLFDGITLCVAGFIVISALGQPAVAETTEEQRAAFQRALELQKAGNLDSAESAYREVLALKPDSAATYNNLAKLQEGRGDIEKALAYYQQAIDIGDDQETYYRFQYGSLLEKSGDSAAAVKQFELVARDRPEIVSAHQQVVNYYLTDAQGGGRRFTRYLWNVLESGEPLRAAEAAIQGLDSGRFEIDTQYEMLTIVAAAIGRPTVTVDQAQQLRERLDATSEGDLQPCVEEFEGLFASPTGAFSWWADHGSAYEEPPQGVWPREAFRSVARKLGRRAELARDFELAENYYRTAATLHPEGLDPLAFEALVKLYTRTEQIERIEELANDPKYIGQLFQQKNEFYRRGQLEKIYNYHVTLGHIFGALAKQDPKWWGDSRTPGSAVFQLERAVMVGEKVNEVDVGVVELLAGYYSANQPGREIKLRLDAAERLAATNRHAAASTIVKPLRNQDLQTIDRARLERLEIKF